MKCSTRTLIASLALAFVGASGCVVESEPEQGAPEEPVAGTQESLVNGAIVPDDRMRSAVALWPNGSSGPNCTGTRIGPRQILTAAHCVVKSSVENDGTPQQRSYVSGVLDEDYGQGRILKYTNKHTVAVEYAQFTSAVIEKTEVYPTWVTNCGAKCAATDMIDNGIPDLAVITLKADLPSSISTAKVDLSPTKPGDVVTVTGYGCESSSLAPSNPRHFKAMANKILSLTEAAAGADAPTPSNPALFSYKYALTPGASFGNTSSLSRPGLCPGDSGGPVYRGYARPGEDVILAVNSAMGGDAANVSRLNYHTRLENGNGYLSEVVGWLAFRVPGDVAAGMFVSADHPTQAVAPTVTWTYVGYPSYARHIAACENGKVYALNANQALYVNSSNGADSGWRYLDSPGDAAMISCAGNTLYAFNKNRTLHRFNGTGYGPKWRYMETMGQAMRMAGNRERLFAINEPATSTSSHTIWSKRNFGSWAQMGNWYYKNSVIAGGIDVDLNSGEVLSRLFLLADGKLWMSKTNGTPGYWTKIDDPWYAMEVAAAGPKVLYALNKDYRLFRGVINQ